MFENEQVIETKECVDCGLEFEITDKDKDFYEKVSPIFNGEKYFIPSPNFCPECRQKKRFAFLHNRKLYKRKCDATGKQIISIYSPDKPYKIYDKNIWQSDEWDPLDYGKEFDFEKPFFEQFNELLLKVPRPHIFSEDNENCDYSYCGHSKNCYLTFIGVHLEDCYYSDCIMYCNKCIDCYDIKESENCYECMSSSKLYGCINVYKSNNCRNCFFSFDLENCHDCYLCYNLQGKSYCILNKQYTKEEYFQKIKDINYYDGLNSYNKNISKHVVKNLNLVNCENCIGDDLINCKDIYMAYWGIESDNCRYSYMSNFNNDCYDSSCFKSNLCLEITAGENIYMSAFNFDLIENNINIYYSTLCSNTKNSFGCIGLKNKEYCILNKQYTKEEYEKLVPKIIEHMKQTGEWGEFFPISISPFGYNETAAQEHFPIEKEEANKKGYKWMDEDYSINIPEGMEKIEAKDLYEDIEQVGDDILNKAILCEVTGRPFRIIKPELEFYRKHNIPLPKRHPDQRYLDRLNQRNPKKLFDRKCDNCSKDIKTTYSPERPEIVYCEKCYNKYIYG